MTQNMPPREGDWYTVGTAREEASAWYGAASAGTETPPPPAQPSICRPVSEAQRRRRMWTKVVSLSVCGALVCAAVAVAALNGDLFRRLRGTELQGSDRVYDYDFGGGTETAPVLPEDQYEDFRDYFENYYTVSSEIDLPAAPTGTGVKLRLYPRQEELSLQEIYDRVSPAVVGINAYLDDLPYSWGTGVVFTSDGYIITNTHILQGCSKAQVVFADGTEYKAYLVGADEASDIAVLDIDGEDLPYARFGDSDTLQVGDKALAIGNPLGKEYTGTMTDGIISAIDRNVTYDGHTMTLLQTNAALNEGNSGGPLINASGQVVGITNMKIMSSYMTAVEGIGFAIPSAVVKDVADQLLENGVVPGEPTIGIVAGSVSAEAMELYGLPRGVYVSRVDEGSDALKKGLQVGDVITAVNGQSVSSVAQVNAIKEGMEVGDSLTLSVYREGETFKLEVELVDRADIR